MENPFRKIPNLNGHTLFDCENIQLIYGDLLIELDRGQGPIDGGGTYKSAILWLYLGQEMTKGYNMYNGEINEFWHVSPSKSKILDVEKLSGSVVNNFINYGAYHIHINSNDERDIYEIINTSDLF